MPSIICVQGKLLVLILTAGLLLPAWGEPPGPPAPAKHQPVCAACQDSGQCKSCAGTGQATCNSCHGKGKQEVKCARCGGDGRLRQTTRRLGKTVRVTRNCSTCGGQGHRDQSCSTCGGDGKVACAPCDGTGKCAKCSGSK